MMKYSPVKIFPDKMFCFVVSEEFYVDIKRSLSNDKSSPLIQNVSYTYLIQFILF